MPRDNIRRDETRTILFGCVLNILERAAQVGFTASLECLDGSALFYLSDAARHCALFRLLGPKISDKL